MLFLSEQQVRDLADVDELIRAIRVAFASDFSRTLHMPRRISLEMSGGATLLLMPAYDSSLPAAGVKLVTVSRASGVIASYDYLDPHSGTVLARMEANYLTDLRTAATSAVATDLLARADAATLGVFGSGRQAAAHLAVLPRVRRFRRFLICGSGHSDLKQFCGIMKADYGLDVEVTDPETCVRHSDVICTCTDSPSPVFDGRWLRPGTHLNLVGAFQPHTREVDDETVRRARVVVDLYESALAEAGELLIPLGNGTITRGHIVADLHEIASAKKRPRASAEDITLFKSVGCALEDLVAAHLIYNRNVTNRSVAQREK